MLDYGACTGVVRCRSGDIGARNIKQEIPVLGEKCCHLAMIDFNHDIGVCGDADLQHTMVSDFS